MLITLPAVRVITMSVFVAAARLRTREWKTHGDTQCAPPSMQSRQEDRPDRVWQPASPLSRPSFVLHDGPTDHD